MPDFENDNISIDVDEYLMSCSTREMKELIEWLREEGEIPLVSTGDQEPEWINADWRESLLKLMHKKHLLTVEEENLILKISGRLV